MYKDVALRHKFLENFCEIEETNCRRTKMPSPIERSAHELYRDDPERADALVFGRTTPVSRRGFLGGSGLAAASAAVGGAIPFAASMPGGLIPAAFAQAGNEPKGPQYLNFSGKSDKLVVLGERPLVA